MSERGGSGVRGLMVGWWDGGKVGMYFYGGPRRRRRDVDHGRPKCVDRFVSEQRGISE